MSRGTYGRTSQKDIAQDARRLKPFMAASGGDTYRVRVSADDTSPNYLEQKLTSADTSVVIAVVNDGADEDLDLSVAVYVAAEIADHAADPDAHHNQVHVLATTAALGPDHTVSGLTAGQVLQATGATTAVFGLLDHDSLANVTADQHHNQSHVLATTSALGPDHTVSGLTSGQVLRATGATTAAFGALVATDLPAHVLATNLALGSQHTISGATAGHVLRASSATAAAFAQLQHSDLGGVGSDDHHAQAHELANTSGLGADHTVAGLTAGQVLQATGATTAVFAALDHDNLTNVTANQHHNQSHVLADTTGLGPDHTTSGLTARQVLIATGATTALFRALVAADLPNGQTLSVASANSGDSHAITSSSAVSTATAVLLATDSNGRVRVQGLGIGTAAAGAALYVNANINLVGDRSIIAGDNAVTINDTFNIVDVDTATLRIRRMDDTRYRLNITPSSTNVTMTAFDNTGAVNHPMVYTAASHTFTGGNATINNSLTVGVNVSVGGDLLIATNGDQTDRFMMTNSDVAGGLVFYDFNDTDRDAGSTGSFEVGFFRDANNTTQFRMSKEVFEIIIKSGGTFRFPLEVRAQQVILAEMPTSDPGIVGALYRSGGTVLIST